jgi:hypothetical protein
VEERKASSPFNGVPNSSLEFVELRDESFELILSGLNTAFRFARQFRNPRVEVLSLPR